MKNKVIENVSVKLIVPDPNQPRQEFDPAAMSSLEKSIAKQGILTPLAIEKMDGGKYLLVDGERRYRASTKLGLKEVPAIVYETMDDKERIMTRFHLQEQHSNWTAFDKAKAIATMQNALNLDVKDTADLLGLSATQVKDYLLLLTLSRRSIAEANKLKLPYEYLANTAEVIKVIDKVDTRRKVEAAIIEKIRDRVVVRASDIHKYRVAIREGGNKVINKILNDSEFTPNEALDSAGVLEKLEHRKLMNQVSSLANTLERARMKKVNQETTSNDAKTVKRLVDALEHYVDTAGATLK